MGKIRISKSKYTSGLQCHKRLFWEFTDPKADELQVDPALGLIFERGTHIGEVAQDYVPGGKLIDFPYFEHELKVSETARLIGQGEAVIYEASFIEDQLFAAIDILEKQTDGTWAIIEVKGMTEVKEHLIADAAVQAYVVGRAGLKVSKVEIMILNKGCVAPDLKNLFLRVDVTDEVIEALAHIPGEIRSQLEMLEIGKEPSVTPGDQCHDPYECPFLSRCWPEVSENHITNLVGVGPRKAEKFYADGIDQMDQIPEGYKLNDRQKRQLRSQKEGKLIIEEGLEDKLKVYHGKNLAFLDFETVMPAIPFIEGFSPFSSFPVQWSCHVLKNGKLTHFEYFPEHSRDPRAEQGRDLLQALDGAEVIFAYHKSVEEKCVKQLSEALNKKDQKALLDKLPLFVDLLPLVRDHVYHPGFMGSFSIKKVVSAFFPELDYSELEIGDGNTASLFIEKYLYWEKSFPDKEKPEIKKHLLKYCAQDTFSLFKLYEKLRELSREGN